MTHKDLRDFIESIKYDLSSVDYWKPWYERSFGELLSEFDRLKSIEEEHNRMLVASQNDQSK